MPFPLRRPSSLTLWIKTRTSLPVRVRMVATGASVCVGWKLQSSSSNRTLEAQIDLH